jgi:hypothetical protein
VETFSPPYLFRGHRPTILAAPQHVPYGTAFDIETTTAAEIASVVLLRAGRPRIRPTWTSATSGWSSTPERPTT